MTTKSQITSAAISGLSIDGGAVARITRGGSVVLRHSWPDNCDARVWDGVSRAAMHLAQERADKTGRAVDVYHQDGSMIDQVQPSNAL